VEVKIGASYTPYYYHADGLGSITGLSDATGTMVQTYGYDAFGNVTATGGVSQPFMFTGREYDSETGMYFYRARYYDPAVGRFVTKDPIGFAGGDVNLYTYIQNDPVNYIDPEGSTPLAVAIGGGEVGFMLGGPPGAVVGAIVGGIGGYLIGDWIWQNTIQMSKASKESDKSRATDIPSWVRDYPPRKPGESCAQYAERVLKEKYGCDMRANERGPGSEYSKIKKNCERN
jgi:RHS repeat-associated protein